MRTFVQSLSMWRAWLVLLAAIAAGPAAADDGLRSVKVADYGIAVRVPQAWRLVSWAHHEQAFSLRVPQESDDREGFVACELGVAPESLEDFHRLHQQAADAAATQPEPTTTLLRNELQTLDEAHYGAEQAAQIGRRLVTVWRHPGERGAGWYEQRVALISQQTLYTFTLVTDQAHWEAYRLDFEEMLRRAVYSAPRTGVEKLPGGYWGQREFRFAIRLPEAWQPAFAPHDNVLFFATGAAHEAFTDNLIVLASPAADLDLKELAQRLPEAVQAEDPAAEVACQVVAQGDGQALETVIRAQRGGLEFTVLQRQFRGEKRNYEIKFTCESGEFARIEAELRKALDSFVEARGDEPPRLVL
jgi:hypothetical protein